MTQTFHLTGKVHIRYGRAGHCTPSAAVLHVDTLYQYARLYMTDHVQKHGAVEMWFLNKEDLQVWASALQQALEAIGPEECDV